MTAARRAVHFDPHQQPAPIDPRPDRLIERAPEAGPAGAALELGLGVEQRMRAASTPERALSLFVSEGTRARTLRAMVAQDLILIGRQRTAPFLVASVNGKFV